MTYLLYIMIIFVYIFLNYLKKKEYKLFIIIYKNIKIFIIKIYSNLI